MLPPPWGRVGEGVTIALLLLTLSACGFQLRTEGVVGVKSLSLATNVSSQVAQEVRRALAAGPTRIVANPAEAEVNLRILTETHEKSIFSLTGAGRVFEHQLRLAVTYQVTVPGREEPIVMPSEIEVRRVVTYSETAPVAKEAEEALLYRDMHAEAAGQILRRIAVLQHKRG